MGNLGYLTKEGFRNLKVNKLMSFASVTVLFSCLMLVGIAFMILVNIESFISGIEAENVIMAFVSDTAGETDVKKVGEDIKKLGNVSSVEFVDKDVAYKTELEKLKKEYGEGYSLSILSDENPLPHAYRVTVLDMNGFQNVVENIKRVHNVSNVKENSSLARQLTGLRDSVSYISIGIIVLLLIVSLFIISNTIKVTMFSRRLEISIMKSVGATNSFIRWPFMVEGMVIGFIAGVLATFAVWGINELALSSFTTMLSTFGNEPDVNFLDYVLWLLLAFIVIGVFTGVFGSAVSMRKYLKERKFVELED